MDGAREQISERVDDAREQISDAKEQILARLDELQNRFDEQAANLGRIARACCGATRRRVRRGMMPCYNA